MLNEVFEYYLLLQRFLITSNETLFDNRTIGCIQYIYDFRLVWTLEVQRNGMVRLSRLARNHTNQLANRFF